MNITISKRAKSLINTKERQGFEVENQECVEVWGHAFEKKSQISQKQQSIYDKNICSRLFEKCFRQPSDFDEFIAEKDSLDLKKTQGIISLSMKTKRQSPHTKLKLTIKKNYKSKQQVKRQMFIKFIQGKQSVSNYKNNYSNEKYSDIIETKRCTNVYPSIANSIASSYVDMRDKPAYFPVQEFKSSEKKELMTQKDRQIQSSQFKSIILENQPNQFKNIEINRHFHELSLTKKPITQRSQNLSKFEIIQLSEADLKIDQDFSNNSLNTSYIKKKIQFYSDKSDKEKMLNCIPQPLYAAICNQDKDKTQSNRKERKNYQSQLINSIKVDNESQFDSPKANSQQESFVLDKGGDEIFHRSPKFKSLSNSQSESSTSHKQINISEIQCNYDSKQHEYWQNLHLYSIKDEILEKL